MPKFREITGQFVGYIPDSADADITPDRAPMSGRVKFIPQFTGGLISFPDLVPPEFARPEPIEARIVDGFVMVEVAVRDGDVVTNILQPLVLMVTEDEEATQAWSWRADFREILIGDATEYASISSWTFSVPDGNSSIDLTELKPVSVSAGKNVVRGPRGVGLDAISAANGELEFVFTDGRNTSVDLPDAVPGPAGEKGAEGPQGPAGVKGDPGSKGDKGDPGTTGGKGATGAKGDKGDPGAPGEKGDKGDKGETGEVENVTAADIVDASATGRSVMTAASAAAARTAIGAGTSTLSAGSAAELSTGTAATARSWTAKVIADNTKARIAESTAPLASSEELAKAWPGADPKCLEQWLFAAASAKARRANVFVLGDSISEGAWAMNYLDGWVHVFARMAQKALTGRIGGRGYVPSIRGFNGTGNGMGAVNGDQWVFTGSPTIDRSEANISGFGRRSIQIATGQTASFTFQGDRFQLMFTGYDKSGTATISVDGGPASSFNTDNGTDPESGMLYTSAALTPGRHTVTVGRSSGNIFLDGGCFFDGDYDAGVTLWDGSHSGYRADHFDGHETASSRWAHGLATVKPDLVLIALGTNDEHLTDSGYTPAVFGQRMRSVIQLIQSKTPDSSIVVIQQPAPASSSKPTDWWDSHMSEAAAAAVDNGATVIDLRPRIPSGPKGAGSSNLYFNSNHPNSAGQRLYAQVVSELMRIPRAVDLNQQSANGAIDSSQTTISNTSASAYSGPDVSTAVTVPESGKVLVTIGARLSHGTSGKYIYVSFTGEGANTFSASGTNAIRVGGGLPSCTYSMTVPLSGLTPGETTFTLVPWVNADSGIVGVPAISVTPI